MQGSFAAVREFLAGYARIPEEEIRHFLGLTRLVRFERGEFMTRAGERPREFGLVRSGLIRKFYVTSRGRDVTRGFAAAGELVGAYAALLGRCASQLSVQALEDSSVLVADFEAFERMYDRHPSWNTLGRRVAEALFVEREQRAAELLTLSAEQRYEALLARNSALVERVPQYQIASYLGITPVSLSRIRARRAAPKRVT
ncbi:Crp/Fnr family transcriptional regulator [Sorangium sp. So ce590]|uniref:Crp/Fnr family transcriptional regulator n=1 Tax=Sorangium sp. So ce590 TaxID=3133317 RepID=UPI003F63459F